MALKKVSICSKFSQIPEISQKRKSRNNEDKYVEFRLTNYPRISQNELQFTLIIKTNSRASACNNDWINWRQLTRIFLLNHTRLSLNMITILHSYWIKQNLPISVAEWSFNMQNKLLFLRYLYSLHHLMLSLLLFIFSFKSLLKILWIHKFQELKRLQWN